METYEEEMIHIAWRLRTRYGIPRDLFYTMIWLWIPPAPPPSPAALCNVHIDDDDLYCTARVGSITASWMYHPVISVRINGTDCCCFCSINLRYGDEFWVNYREFPERNYEVCFQCHYEAEKMGYEKA